MFWHWYLLFFQIYNLFRLYLHQKHNLSPAKMDKVNTIALQSYLSSLKIHKCASIVKMIHNWIATYRMLSRQGREPSPICPRCGSVIETSDHGYRCSQVQAVTNWRSYLLSFFIFFIICRDSHLHHHHFWIQTINHTGHSIPSHFQGRSWNSIKH